MDGAGDLSFRLISTSDAANFLQLILANTAHLSNFFPVTVREISDLSSAESFVAYKVSLASRKQAYYFLIFSQRKMVGVLSIKHVNRPEKKAEIAYFVDENYQGKGIMKKSICWVSRFCFGELQLTKIVARIDAGNLASRSVLVNNGFVFEKTVPGDYTDSLGNKKDSEQYARLSEVES